MLVIFVFGMETTAAPIDPLTVSYGSNAAQKLDVYSLANIKNAPIIVMVHGGAWRFGDKESRAVTDNKLNYWLPKGYLFISINYRLLPDADPLMQAKDVARALRFIQSNAQDWGGDSNKIIVMGHSAGAHLVALLSASRDLQTLNNLKPWRGSVMLDSAALDVTSIMGTKHAGFYDEAFGKSNEYWQAASPTVQLTQGGISSLLVCSSQREDACAQAQAFAARAGDLNVAARVLPQALSHRDINVKLGEENEYTKAVDNFISMQLKK